MYASYVAAAALAYFITSRFLLCMRRRRLIVQYACQPFQSRYPHKDLFLGIGLFVKVQRKFQTHGFCVFLTGLGRRYGTTYQTYFLGTTTVQTIDTENIKTVLATKFDDWEITPGRIDSLSTLLGKGIFTTNGLDWRRSRKLVTPNLAREQYKDLGLYDRHLNRLINRIPSDGQTVVDLQDLFLDFTMDTTTELLMGHSVDSQVNLDGVTGEFSTAYETAKDHDFKNLRNPTFAWLQDQRPLFSAVRIVHALVDRFIEQASSSLRTQASEDSKLQRYNLLNEMMSLTDDKTQIRSEILNLLLAGRDSTASTLANLFFVLARQPEVEKKLREEVDRLQGSRPSFELLKAMKYLRWCFNEVLRLYPPIPVSSRLASRDTILPRGGGRDGHAPVFVSKGSKVYLNIYGLHRRQDLYGEDAHEFTPERWESSRPEWAYLPFIGGPRKCVGQQLALTQAMYATVCILQAFREVKAPDNNEWKENLLFTASNLHGTKVVMIPT